ncbi:50S ribosomal protein L23 [Candidatus Curtissbacteria bacterium]|nr:50S ribosomal protein L23 [Candidatus Curtissbacteria bacterium]
MKANWPHIIKGAILSEKAYKLMEKGVYTFLVDRRATKAQLANAIADQFAVKVKKINVATFAPKRKRITQTRKFTRVGGGRKAIVFLEPGQNIPLLSPKKEGLKSKKSDEKKKNLSKKEEGK